LTSINYADYAKLDWYYSSTKYVIGICAVVHQVKFCYNSKCASSYTKKKCMNGIGVLRKESIEAKVSLERIYVLPSGSASRANFSASEVEKSVFAEETAKMMEFGFDIYVKIISLICCSISGG
jgi:hypothetical protein